MKSGRSLLAYVLLMAFLMMVVGVSWSIPLLRIHRQGVQVHTAVVEIEQILGRLRADETSIAGLAKGNSSRIELNSTKVVDTSQALDELRQEVADTRTRTAVEVQRISSSHGGVPVSPEILSRLDEILARLDRIEARLSALEERPPAPPPSQPPGPPPPRRFPKPSPSSGPGGGCVVPPFVFCASAAPQPRR
jgi:hypothetical protein